MTDSKIIILEICIFPNEFILGLLKKILIAVNE